MELQLKAKFDVLCSKCRDTMKAEPWRNSILVEPCANCHKPKRKPTAKPKAKRKVK